jgi:suppressor of fused-like protein
MRGSLNYVIKYSMTNDTILEETVLSSNSVLSEPLDGIIGYTLPDQFVYVTLGYSELYDKESPDPEVSGFGFEMVFRCERARNDSSSPAWIVPFLQNLATHVFNSGKVFMVSDAVHFATPIVANMPENITGCYFLPDAELSPIRTKNGSVNFILAVGITDAQWQLYQEKGAEMLQNELKASSSVYSTKITP